MIIVFTVQSWEEYQYWQKTDEKILEKINILIKDCLRNQYKGLGKPEPLKGDLKGFWSRRIDQEHRLVYRIESNQLQIIQCRYHYR
jgi:toxin YoeB